MIYKLLSEQIPLNANSTNVGLATRVLISHAHAGGPAHEIVVRNAANTILGSVNVLPSHYLTISKNPTDTIEEPSDTGDMFVTKVGVTG